MTPKERQAWNSRPMTVRVVELCLECKVLKEGVKKREGRLHGYGALFKLHSCERCFEDAKRRRESEAHAVVTEG